MRTSVERFIAGGLPRWYPLGLEEVSDGKLHKYVPQWGGIKHIRIEKDRILAHYLP
jgi:hypothetical protein